MDQKQIKSELSALYAEIPKMQCKPGCTKCCGYIPWSKFEYSLLEDKREIDCLCVYPEKGRCSIYEQRPLMCRLFGTVEPPHILSCPQGCLPLFPLSPDQAKSIVRRYSVLFKY